MISKKRILTNNIQKLEFSIYKLFQILTHCPSTLNKGCGLYN